MAEQVGAIYYDVDMNTGKLLDAQRTVERSVNASAKSFDTLTASAKTAAAAIAGIFAAGAIVNELNNASKAASTFESSLAEISAIAGVTGKELDKLGDVAKGFANVGVSATQGADAIKKIGAARPEVLKSASALKSLTDDIITLRDAGKVDMAQAVDAVVLSLNQFSAASSESSRFVNVLAAGAAAGASEIRDTSEALKDAGSTAYSVGASFESVNAALQILAAGGLKGSQAGNALRNIMLKLAETGDKNLMPSTVGLTGALENLAKKNMSAAEMIKFFGLENYNAAAAIVQNIGKLGEMEKAITGTSEASKQAAIQNQTYQKQLEKMQASIESVRIELGEKLNPTLGKAAQLVSEFLNNRDQEGSAFQMTLTGIGIAAQSTAAIIAGRLVSAIALSTTASVAATLAKRAELAETVRVTEAELAQAQAAARVATATAAMGGSSTAAAAAQSRLATATAAATAAQTAYASSATAAGIALRGWGALLGAMGGWVGIAVTALTLLAFNWDKVSGAAESAAKISENAADRIRRALSGASATPMRDLIDGMSKAQKDLADIDKQLASGKKYTTTVGPRAFEEQRALTKEEIANLTERREALRGAVVDYQKARDDLKASQIAGLFPDKPPEPSKPSGGTGGGTTTKKEKFDSQGYINDLVIANADGLAKINAQEQDALDKAKKLLDEKKLTQQEYEQAVTLIRLAASKDRAEIQQKERDDLQDWLDEQLRMEEEAAKKRQEAFENARSTADPMAALRAEYEAKLKLFDEYQAQLLERGITAETDQQAARTAITAEYETQRQALTEQTFRNQSEANAFLLDSLESLSSTASSAITGLIDGTTSGKDAMIELGRTIRNQAIQTLVEMGIQYVKNAVIAKATTAATTAAQVAATSTVTAANIAGTAASTSAAVAGAGAIAAAAAPAAALTSVASFGTAAVVGLGALAATMVAAKAFGGGRQYGGAVNADSFYRVNETGAPEMFTASNGRQYMMPNTRGEVTPANKLGGGVTINIVNTMADATVTATSSDSGTVDITVQRAVAEVASQIASNSGQVWSAMKGATNVQSKL